MLVQPTLVALNCHNLLKIVILCKDNFNNRYYPKSFHLLHAFLFWLFEEYGTRLSRKAGKVYLMSRLNKHLSEGRENLEDLEKQVWLVKSWKLWQDLFPPTTERHKPDISANESSTTVAVDQWEYARQLPCTTCNCSLLLVECQATSSQT